MREASGNTNRRQAYGLIGASEGIRKVRETIRKLSRDQSPVLITGESGVGKELVARALHQTSELSSRVFLPIDSASLVGRLMESELFGYQKGAFTGAADNKIGLVRAADGGTLFLDEVGELPPDIQAKLLRLLQEGEMRPIGGVQPVRVNVRILAATNRDLEAEVKSRTFRKDLYYRLNVIHIHVPPLRERREDIPELVQHFIARHAIHQVVMSNDVMELFQYYGWPGNVRELENTVRRVVALKSNPLVSLDDLPTPLLRAAEGRSRSVEPVLPLAELERRHILRVMELTKGDVTSAAHMLGVGRTTLYRRLKDYRCGVIANHSDQQDTPPEASMLSTQ
ncbi:MAG: AAA domain-containing protein [Acidobacteria bacterium]|nr:AAA domain-containing protein [Acidobacteriota bacterium]